MARQNTSWQDDKIPLEAAARAKSPSDTTPEASKGGPKKKTGPAGRRSGSTDGYAIDNYPVGGIYTVIDATGTTRKLNQEHYTNTHFPVTAKNDRRSRVPAAAAAFFRATRRWRRAFVSFWWHGVHNVRKLSRLQQPPPSATGII